MKSFLKILGPVALVSLFTIVAHSQGKKTLPSVKANLLTFNVSKNWSDLQGMQEGTIQIDYVNKEVTLTLVPRGSCAKNFCRPSIRPPVVVTLPIVETRDEICNIHVIEAKRDRRAVDAPLETMLIQDNTKYNCEHVVEMPATRVTYTEEGGWNPALYSAEFGAEALK